MPDSSTQDSKLLMYRDLMTNQLWLDSNCKTEI